MPYPAHLHTDRPLPPVVDAVPHQGKQLIEIILLKDELLHDIQSDIVRVEKSRKLEVPVLTNEDADGYDLNRKIDNYVNKAVSRMQAYLLLPSPFVHRISTNHTRLWEETSIYLALPHNWAPHCIDPLRDAVHNYIVKSVEYELMAVVLPNDPYTAICNNDADRAYNDINALINTRLGPTRIHPTPFG